jgi:C4-dicarboxylate-specific signal transduction histidine kinase
LFDRLTTRWRTRFHSSLRLRLVALALLPLLVVVPLVIGVLAGWGAVYFDRLLIGKVRSDLAVAHGYFEQVKESVGRRVEALATSEMLARRLREQPTIGALTDFLREAQQQSRTDFLILVDARGEVRAASHGPAPGTRLPVSNILHRALGGRADTEIDIFTATELTRIDPALAQRAITPLIPTQNAQPTTRTEETRGMLIQSAAPATGGYILLGGMLLNKNLDFVDRLNEIVYPEGALPLGSVGTATLFLDDVRIATNVRLFEGDRAIGTRVSHGVRHAVLDEGHTWLDRAFVVNDWYVSAYEPVVDSNGERRGMLYVGFLETPFRHARLVALGLVISLFVGAAALAAFISLRLARQVSRPVERMHAVMSDIESGGYDARVGAVAGEDELAALAAHFDQLLDKLAEQTAALQDWGAELDGRVADRTRELAAANASLRSAQQRLVMSEKLAAIGQLAAGVAHEINNPVAVIQGNLDVLRETLGDAAEPVMGEIRLIQDQVFRIRLIVAKLLQFVRPTEYAGFVESIDVNLVVHDSLVLVGHQIRKGNIKIKLELYADQRVMLNRNELQQVLINLIVNAMQAMPEGGMLTLISGASHREGVDGVFVAVVDSGPGISGDDRARLFDPFFTTKAAADGTGLGLWVSLGLVERYGGRIEVDCPPEGGTVFSVWLPAEAAAGVS